MLSVIGFIEQEYWGNAYDYVEEPAYRKVSFELKALPLGEGATYNTRSSDSKAKRTLKSILFDQYGDLEETCSE